MRLLEKQFDLHRETTRSPSTSTPNIYDRCTTLLYTADIDYLHPQFKGIVNVTVNKAMVKFMLIIRYYPYLFTMG